MPPSPSSPAHLIAPTKSPRPRRLQILPPSPRRPISSPSRRSLPTGAASSSRRLASLISHPTRACRKCASWDAPTPGSRRLSTRSQALGAHRRGGVTARTRGGVRMGAKEGQSRARGRGVPRL